MDEEHIDECTFEGDQTLVCQQCGCDFPFTEREQRFFHEMGFVTPRYCHSCRKARKEGNIRPSEWKDFYEVVCAKCGKDTTVPFKPVHGRPVYCRECLNESRGDQPDQDKHQEVIAEVNREPVALGLTALDDAERPYSQLEDEVEKLLKELYL